MIIVPLENCEKLYTLYDEDKNKREINIYNLKDVIATGKSMFYPNILLYSKIDNKIILPINEKTMSLSMANNDDTTYEYNSKEKYTEENNPLFYFIYNTDNYYHFVYDTLPYLISFIKLRKKINNIKLLMNFPNPSMNNFYKYIIEFLEILDIKEESIILINDTTIYNNIYISTSYTHGIDSNKPPRKEVYNFFQAIVKKVKNNDIIYPKKIYISRRSWVHGDFTNIGTNYTTKRKLINEDELVNILTEKYNYVEIFTENLSTIDKINIFSSAENIIGPIGGGLCNVLFSNKNCKLLTILSPTFLKVNNRFKYSFTKIKSTVFKNTVHVDNSTFKLYMRIKYKNLIGEIIEKDGNNLKIQYNKIPVSGWNNNSEYETIIVNSNECVKLDDGLNSNWIINMHKFKEKLNKYENE